MIADDELARAFQAGDAAAFAALYGRHKQRLYGLCLRLLGDAETAKDVVHNVFLRAYERRRQLADPSRFALWLTAIARNASLSVLRVAEREVALSDEVPDGRVIGPLARTEREDESDIVRRAIGALRPEDREVLVLREYQELSYREIATMTGSTESAVKSRLFKTRRHLHEILRSRLAERSEP